MPTTRQLRDVYRFPDFEPLATVHGLNGDWENFMAYRIAKEQEALYQMAV